MKRIIVYARRLLFIFVVLFIGQIKLGPDTVGGHFLTVVKRGFGWGTEQFLKTKLAGTLVGNNVVDKWLNNVQPKPAEATSKVEPPKKESAEGTQITSSDRESILRMLQ